jgi:two-component system, OmpR family, phosphate regulon response regulator PhoB
MTEHCPPKRILIVDDETDMRIFVSTVCKTNGYDALTVGDGHKALEAARSYQPQLVVLDIMMPKIEDGVQTFYQFKTDPEFSHIPIIMLSAIARKTFFYHISLLTSRSDGHQYEPDGYIEKPPDAAELIHLIATILSAHSAPAQ